LPPQYSEQRDLELTRQANEHLGFMAHELRNPLSSARMAFVLLRDRGDLPSSGRVVGALERGLQRASELIEQTLQMARLTSGVELHKEPTTLATLFADAELAALPDALAKNIDIRTNIARDARMSLDVRLVRSALTNLVRNAVKYTPADGKVELRGKIEDETAVFEVEDRCGGLPPDKLEAVFAPFVRLDTRESGFGLGLAIAKQAVAAHDGKLRVQNLPGIGCIFILELPLV
jgi:signal transduction histidine kinase